MPILSIMLFLPVVGLTLIMFMHKERQVNLVRATAAFFAALTFAASIAALGMFRWRVATMQLQEKVPWIDSLNINYHLGVDGLSMPLILLTTLLSLLVIIYSWRIEERVKEYMAFFLLLEAGMLGVFCSLDFFLFYIFWEISLVPMYFIIGIWGGARRQYAAIKFFIYTLVGSLAMLLAILGLYFASSPHTFDMMALAQQNPLAGAALPAALIFWGLFLGFAIKVPMFPFHTWLPDAHVEAPTGGSVILAGVLLKMGAYGFIRVSLPILPEASRQFAPAIAILALISIVYGALVAMAQNDLKKLVAYSSVNHMGYVMLGVAAAAFLRPGADSASLLVSRTTALNGAVLQMVAHGIITGALFFLVGMIYDRAHIREIDGFGGLSKQMPVYAGITMLACFASLGLPGLVGFVAEFMVFLGAFGSFKIITGLALLGVVITAAYFLWTIQRIFLGPLNRQWAALPDMDAGELIALVPLCALMVVFGVYPDPLLRIINTAMEALVNHMDAMHTAAASLSHLL